MKKINQRDSKGLKQGYWEEESIDSWEIIETGIYIDNKREGIWNSYFNGDLSSRRQKGVKWTSEDPNLPPNHRGRLIERGKYKSGKKDGMWREWWLWPTTKSEGKYKEGKKHGKWRFYDNTSPNMVSEIGTFVKGEMSGIWTRFYKNERKQSEGLYIKDKREGIWKWYNEDGSRDSIVPYKSNLEEGVAERYWSYWAGGDLWQRGVYKGGNGVGLWCDFYGGKLTKLYLHEKPYGHTDIIALFLAATEISLSDFIEKTGESLSQSVYPNL